MTDPEQLTDYKNFIAAGEHNKAESFFSMMARQRNDFQEQAHRAFHAEEQLKALNEFGEDNFMLWYCNGKWLIEHDQFTRASAAMKFSADTPEDVIGQAYQAVIADKVT